MYWLVDRNVTKDSQEPNPIFTLEAMAQYSLIQYSWRLENIIIVNENWIEISS